MKYKILTHGRLSGEFQDFIKINYPTLSVVKADSKDELKNLLPKVNAVAGFNFLTSEDLSTIKWIHAFGAGIDSFLTLDLHPDTIITRTTGDLGRKIGEFVLAYILTEIKAIIPIYANQNKRIWKQLPTANLSDLNILVLGTGSIGQGVAQKLKNLTKNVIGLNRSKTENSWFDEIWDWSSVQESDLKIDVMINTLPETKETVLLLNKRFFKNFNQLILINVGRGNTLQEKELEQAIQRGNVRTGILDVFSEEPLPKTSPLWANKNVLISPHQSGITTFEDISSSFNLVYDALATGERNHLFVDLERGY